MRMRTPLRVYVRVERLVPIVVAFLREATSPRPCPANPHAGGLTGVRSPREPGKVSHGSPVPGENIPGMGLLRPLQDFKVAAGGHAKEPDAPHVAENIGSGSRITSGPASRGKWP